MSTDTVRGRAAHWGGRGTVPEAGADRERQRQCQRQRHRLWQAVLHFILFCPTTKCPLIRSKQAQFGDLVRNTYCISSMCGTCDRSNSWRGWRPARVWPARWPHRSTNSWPVHACLPRQRFAPTGRRNYWRPPRCPSDRPDQGPPSWTTVLWWCCRLQMRRRSHSWRRLHCQCAAARHWTSAGHRCVADHAPWGSRRWCDSAACAPQWLLGSCCSPALRCTPHTAQLRQLLLPLLLMLLLLFPRYIPLCCCVCCTFYHLHCDYSYSVCLFSYCLVWLATHASRHVNKAHSINSHGRTHERTYLLCCSSATRPFAAAAACRLNSPLARRA